MEIQDRFEKHGQGHVFKYWDELDENQRSALLEQAEEVDLVELDELVNALVKGDGEEAQVDFDTLKPAPYTPRPKSIATDEAWQKAKALGEDAIRAGKVALFTVAGGQGTRLGYDGPKGTYPVTPIKAKTLFQVFAEKALAARNLYDASIPWYIMTSHLNHEATEQFFKDHDYFGLGADNVRFFRQGRMAAVDFDGKIILESTSSIAMSPDGHGGALRALDRSGAISDMRKRGVEALSYFQVDNPLIQIIDPYFIGFHFQSGSEMSGKMLPKAYAGEKVGHFCESDGQLVVVEYSDMPEELTERRDDDGNLVFLGGSIAIHIVAVDFIAKLGSPNSEVQLPFHRATKKIAYLTEEGETVKPSEANGVKFEMFVFDALPFSGSPLILETTRLGDFSPVKNAEGVDSAQSCKADQMKLFAKWLADQGVTVEVDEDGVPVKLLEVAPSFAYSDDTFAEAWKKRGGDVDTGSDLYLE